MTKHLSLLDEVFTVQTGHSLRSMFVAQAVGASATSLAHEENYRSLTLNSYYISLTPTVSPADRSYTHVNRQNIFKIFSNFQNK